MISRTWAERYEKSDARIDGVTVEALLGSHVVGSAQALAVRRDSSLWRRREMSRHTQVEQFHLPGRGQHQVGGFNVAVDQTLFMNVL